MKSVKPCPFCGYSGLKVCAPFGDAHQSLVAVACENCGAVGPTVNDRLYREDGEAESEAVSRWNDRETGEADYINGPVKVCHVCGVTVSAATRKCGKCGRTLAW